MLNDKWKKFTERTQKIDLGTSVNVISKNTPEKFKVGSIVTISDPNLKGKYVVTSTEEASEQVRIVKIEDWDSASQKVKPGKEERHVPYMKLKLDVQGEGDKSIIVGEKDISALSEEFYSIYSKTLF